MKTLSIDIETYSSADLTKTGVYKYAESPDFDILLFGYSEDGGPVRVVDLANGEQLPHEIIAALSDTSVIKTAFNAQFERICISRWLKMNDYPLNNEDYSRSDNCLSDFLNPSGWHCTMVWAAYLGLPQSLADVGEALHLDRQKLSTGKNLIRYFCVPCKPTKKNGGRTRNLPIHTPDKWDLFKAYNVRDVETEMDIQNRISKYPVPDFVWEEYRLDQEINDRGILLDLPFVECAIRTDETVHDALKGEMRKLTGVWNPASLPQLKQWLSDNGLDADGLGKDDLPELIEQASPKVRNVLLLRQQLAKSSVRKYNTMRVCACADGRARGMFRFYGANRTGRFSGKLIQLQNLPQNHLPDLEDARKLVLNCDSEALSMLYVSVPDVLSELIRTAFIAPPGKTFCVADFSAIEARVIAWLAGEEWRNEVFRSGGDIYCASASRMFKVPVVKNGVNGHLRQKGKIAELALGYGGSIGALKAMGALNMGLSEDELLPLVSAWRRANPNIVSLWDDIDSAAVSAIYQKCTEETHGITFSVMSKTLFVTLPSGRQLAYGRPAIGTNKFGGRSITYMGIGPTKRWDLLETYGPKLTENIVQGIARDLLCYAMQNLKHMKICGHVHDELIIEADTPDDLASICETMAQTPPWADGLVLRADGYTTPFYKKE